MFSTTTITTTATSNLKDSRMMKDKLVGNSGGGRGVARGCGAQAGDAPGGPGGYRGRRRRGDAARRDMASAIPRHTRPSATAGSWTSGQAVRSGERCALEAPAATVVLVVKRPGGVAEGYCTQKLQSQRPWHGASHPCLTANEVVQCPRNHKRWKHFVDQQERIAKATQVVRNPRSIPSRARSNQWGPERPDQAPESWEVPEPQGPPPRREAWRGRPGCTRLNSKVRAGQPRQMIAGPKEVHVRDRKQATPMLESPPAHERASPPR